MSVRVKICGVNAEDALEAACAAGADALGFVLAPSPRQVSPRRATELLRRVPRGVERVAVLARATRAELLAALALGVDALQAELDSEWPSLPDGVFALPVVRDDALLEERAAAWPRGSALERSLRGALVLDGPAGGGRGIPVNVERARRMAAARPIVLAGGLDASNVAARILAVRPLAVDASSGLESAPGRKDPSRIRAFVRAVRSLELCPPETFP